jgi:hypothetical protein
MLIGLIAPAGTGKDTAGDYLTEKYGFIKIAFSDAIYAEVAEKYGVDESILKNRTTKESPLSALGGLSPREALQKHGDDRRACNPEYFIEIAEKNIIKTGGNIVISDVRFRNEANMVKKSGGVIVRIIPDGFQSVLSENTARHISETDVVNYPADRLVVNVFGDKKVMLWQIKRFILTAGILPTEQAKKYLKIFKIYAQRKNMSAVAKELGVTRQYISSIIKKGHSAGLY